MSRNPSARLEKLRWPVMIVLLRKKIFKKFEKIVSLNEILLKFKIIKSSKPFNCLKRLSSIH